jgi:hypothetical protein
VSRPTRKSVTSGRRLADDAGPRRSKHTIKQQQQQQQQQPQSARKRSSPSTSTPTPMTSSLSSVNSATVITSATTKITAAPVSSGSISGGVRITKNSSDAIDAGRKMFTAMRGLPPSIVVPDAIQSTITGTSSTSPTSSNESVDSDNSVDAVPITITNRISTSSSLPSHRRSPPESHVVQHTSLMSPLSQLLSVDNDPSSSHGSPPYDETIVSTSMKIPTSLQHDHHHRSSSPSSRSPVRKQRRHTHNAATAADASYTFVDFSWSSEATSPTLNMPLTHVPRAIPIYEETRVIRLALLQMLPWLRDHIAAVFQPDEPVYRWMCRVLGRRARRALPRICPYCISPQSPCVDCRDQPPLKLQIGNSLTTIVPNHSTLSSPPPPRVVPVPADATLSSSSSSNGGRPAGAPDALDEIKGLCMEVLVSPAAMLQTQSTNSNDQLVIAGTEKSGRAFGDVFVSAFLAALWMPTGKHTFLILSTHCYPDAPFLIISSSISMYDSCSLCASIVI